MRTRRSTVAFRHPFALNGDVGELPPGSYEIEIDEEEIEAADRTAYRRLAIYFYAQKPGSTRTIVLSPADLDSAVERDLKTAAGLSNATAD